MPPATGASPRGAETTAGQSDAPGGKLAQNNSPVGKRRTVELVIDYGDGVQKHFDEIAWKESMTVLDVLQAGSRHSHGITFTSHGTGESLLISKLDDLANQGGTTSDKNWIFRVNGQLGDESCALAKVNAGDTVLWKFGPYE